MRNTLTIRECILLIALGLLGLAYLGKDVQVVEKKVIKTDTIVEVKKIDLQITSAPVQITQIIKPHILELKDRFVEIPAKAKKYSYRDTIPNGVIRSTIYADSIYARILNYERIDEQKTIKEITEITKFDNRLMLGVYTNFAHTRNTGIFDHYGYTWDESGLELLYIRNRMYFGISVGLTQNKFTDDWVRDNSIDGVVGFKYGIKLK